MITPTVSPNMYKGLDWRRRFLKAAGFGGGCAAVLCLLAIGLVWYSHRPKPPRPWNKAAFKSQFYRVYTSPETKHFVFDYVIENTTNSDYRLGSSSEFNMTVISDGHLAMCEECVTLPTLPIFIPAGRKMLVPIQLNSTVPSDLEIQLHGVTDEDGGKIVKKYVAMHYTQLEGFILYDEKNRFEIDFPKGWAEGK
jgi:hypothetical protein